MPTRSRVYFHSGRGSSRWAISRISACGNGLTVLGPAAVDVVVGDALDQRAAPEHVAVVGRHLGVREVLGPRSTALHAGVVTVDVDAPGERQSGIWHVRSHHVVVEAAVGAFTEAGSAAAPAPDVVPVVFGAIDDLLLDLPEAQGVGHDDLLSAGIAGGRGAFTLTVGAMHRRCPSKVGAKFS